MLGCGYREVLHASCHFAEEVRKMNLHLMPEKVSLAVAGATPSRDVAELVLMVAQGVTMCLY